MQPSFNMKNKHGYYWCDECDEGAFSETCRTCHQPTRFVQQECQEVSAEPRKAANREAEETPARPRFKPDFSEMRRVVAAATDWSKTTTA